MIQRNLLAYAALMRRGALALDARLEFALLRRFLHARRVGKLILPKPAGLRWIKAVLFTHGNLGSRLRPVLLR